MKGLIDGLSLFLNNGQIGNFNQNFIDYLLKYKNYDIEIAKDYGIKSNKYSNHCVEIFLDRKNDNYDNLGKYIKNNDISFYHCLNNGFSIPQNYDFNYIMSITNLMPLSHEKHCSPTYMNNFFSKFPFSVMKSEYIICPSMSCKKEFLRNFSTNEKNVFVNYGFTSNSFTKIDKFMSDIYIKSKFNIDFPFIIFYGDFNSRKNLDRCILLFYEIHLKIPDLHFIISSDNFNNYNYMDELNNLSSKLQISNSIHFVESLNLHDRSNLFNSALFFIDLSSYECLNLNIIDAFKCETPIICSEIDLYKEYFGDYVFYYNDNSSSILNYLDYFHHNKEDFTINKFNNHINLKIINNIYNNFIN